MNTRNTIRTDHHTRTTDARSVPPSGTMPSPTNSSAAADPPATALDSRWLLDIPQTCAALHCSRAKLFRMLAAGEIGPSVRIGRRRLIPVTAIETYIARLIVEDGGEVAS